MDAFSGKMMKDAQSRANELAHLMQKWNLNADDLTKITKVPGRQQQMGFNAGSETALSRLHDSFSTNAQAASSLSREDLAALIASDEFVQSFEQDSDFWHGLLEDLNDISKAFSAFHKNGNERLGIKPEDDQAKWLRRGNLSLEYKSPLDLIKHGPEGVKLVADFVSDPTSVNTKRIETLTARSAPAGIRL